MKYLKMTGNIVLYFLIYYLCQFISGLIVSSFIIFKFINKFGKEYVSHLNEVHTILTSLTSILIVVGSIISTIIILLILKRKNKNLVELFMIKKISIKNIIVIIMQAIGLAFICSCFLTLTQDIFKDYSQVSEMIISFKHSVLSIICYTIFIPIFEEFLFRGVIFNELRKNINIVFSILIQALIFAIAHGNIAQMIYTFVLGVLASLIYIWTKSLASNIILHIGFNIFGTFLIPNVVYQNQNYILFYIIIGMILIGASILLLYNSKILNSSKENILNN